MGPSRWTSIRSRCSPGSARPYRRRGFTQSNHFRGPHRLRRMLSVRYAGVLASASKLRPRILPEPPKEEGAIESANEEVESPPQRCRYRPWAELMMRTFAVDVLCCPRCSGRLRLVALMTEHEQICRYLRALGESTEAPERSPARGPPFWASRALRRRTGDVDAA